MKPRVPSVAILLATLNGSAFLRAQLMSICAQTHRNWHIILSDDGSCDDTLAIAQDCVPSEQLYLTAGPQTGLALNFWNALMHVPDGHHAAFCDQDDVWRTDKLERALTHINRMTGNVLYSSGRYICDAHMNTFGVQPRSAPRSFARTLFRNRVAWHTCLLSPDAVKALKRFPPSRHVPFHDWWAALVLGGLGTQFIHDPVPTLYYRQHDRNVIGAQKQRIKMLSNGTYTNWVAANHQALSGYASDFIPSAQRALRICLPLRAGLSVGRT